MSEYAAILIDTIALIDRTRVTHAADMPQVVWNTMHHASARLQAELRAYLRSED